MAYTPYVWRPEDFVPPDKMNHIEQTLAGLDVTANEAASTATAAATAAAAAATAANNWDLVFSFDAEDVPTVSGDVAAAFAKVANGGRVSCSFQLPVDGGVGYEERQPFIVTYIPGATPEIVARFYVAWLNSSTLELETDDSPAFYLKPDKIAAVVSDWDTAPSAGDWHSLSSEPA